MCCVPVYRGRRSAYTVVPQDGNSCWFLETESVARTLSSSMWLRCLTRKFQGSACLCLLGGEVRSTHDPTFLLTWV